MSEYFNSKDEIKQGDSIRNLKELDEDFLWRDKVGLITKSLGAAAGSRRLYVNIDQVPPKAYSTKYHSHSNQEEFFLILEGEGILRLNDREYVVKKGDFFAKPAGEKIAHQFFNSGNEMLEILDVGPSVLDDVCYYPDEEIYMVKSNGERKVFHKDTMVGNWSSDPN